MSQNAQEFFKFIKCYIWHEQKMYKYGSREGYTYGDLTKLKHVKGKFCNMIAPFSKISMSKI